MRTRKKLPPPYISRQKLPKKYRGADVVRGLGMDYDKYNRLFERKAFDHFDARGDIFLVVKDRALEGLHPDTAAFAEKKHALRYARANGNGNIDYRVLRVTEQTLVIATENDLDE